MHINQAIMDVFYKAFHPVDAMRVNAIAGRFGMDLRAGFGPVLGHACFDKGLFDRFF